MTVTATPTPTERLSQAVQGAVSFARDIQHDPRFGRPSLARLRVDGADYAKRQAYWLTSRDAIKYDDSDAALAHVILSRFEPSIQQLDAARDGASAKTAVRIDGVLAEMRSHVDAIKAAQRAIDEARKQEEQVRSARFPRDRSRDRAIRMRGALIADLLDLADYFELEGGWPINASNTKLMDIMIALADKVEVKHCTNLTEAGAALNGGAYARAWSRIDSIITDIEEGEDK